MLSRLANADPARRMEDMDLMATGVLLLVAGHETTVNLIANGTLTMLRHPHLLARMRDDPSTAPRFVEELLRMEPPVQYLPNRIAMADIEIGGTTIPKGSRVVLLLAAASRDPDRFADPDVFDPDRPDNQHYGFGGGIHYCFGAPLARLEGQLALTAFARRVQNPRLVEDPPPYRPSPVLRGPLHLKVDIDGISD
jgi:cytochrome P450